MNEMEQPINVGEDFYENQEKELRYAVYNVMRQMVQFVHNHNRIPNELINFIYHFR